MILPIFGFCVALPKVAALLQLSLGGLNTLFLQLAMAFFLQLSRHRTCEWIISLLRRR